MTLSNSLSAKDTDATLIVQAAGNPLTWPSPSHSHNEDENTDPLQFQLFTFTRTKSLDRSFAIRLRSHALDLDSVHSHAESNIILQSRLSRQEVRLHTLTVD